MKKLFLVRHAKSSWDYPELTDFERPLNKRGKKDAPLMGEVFIKLNINPDQIISSPAVRAITTARTISELINYPVELINTIEAIYEVGTRELFELIKSTDDKIKSLMIFGHNPSLTLLNNYISDKYIDNIPTCGMTAIEFDIESWEELKPESGKLKLFEFPKKYKKKK